LDSPLPSERAFRVTGQNHARIQEQSGIVVRPDRIAIKVKASEKEGGFEQDNAG
jgi:hypothetical protein